MPLSSLKRRFMIKHMPGVLTASNDAERNRERQHLLRTTAEQGDPLPMMALAFCRSNGVTLDDADILTEFFGVGPERFYHAESLLMGSDLESMSLMDDLLQVRARETRNWLPENLRPSLDQFIEEERQHYHLWLMNHQPGMAHAQHIVVSSLHHALHRLIETMAYEHLRKLIPNTESADSTHLWIATDEHAEQTRPTLYATLPFLAEILEGHVDRLAPIYQDAGKLVAGDGTLPDDQDARRSEYIVLDPEAYARVRLTHFESDLRAGTESIPYPVWEQDVRGRVSSQLREQLAEVVAKVSPLANDNVVSLADFRAATSPCANHSRG